MVYIISFYLKRFYRNVYPFCSFTYLALKAFERTFLRTLQFFFLFFMPDIGKYLGNKMLGDYTDYFRKVFWDSMDSRSVTKTKRRDLIDSLLQLKNENPDDTHFRKYSTTVYIRH